MKMVIICLKLGRDSNKVQIISHSNINSIIIVIRNNKMNLKIIIWFLNK
jgi:hypothetical protein